MRQHDSRLRHGSPLGTVRAWRYATALASSDAMPLHGDCEAPVYREVRGADSHVLDRLRRWKADPSVDYAEGHGLIGDITPQPPRTDTAYLKVRCRKCPRCLDLRRRQWTAKAMLETKLSSRSWFVTLTFDPQRRWLAKAAAESRTRRRRAEGWSMLTPDERYRAIERETSPEVTRWLKRLRKNSGAALRYLLVSEKHSDGFPHYHVLIHEAAGSSATKRAIQGAWVAGFSNAKVIAAHDVKATYYVCKYLNKSASTRVRASQHYGSARHAADIGTIVGVITEKLRNRLSSKGEKLDGEV